MQSVTEEGGSPGIQIGTSADKRSADEVKNLSGPFRDHEIGSQPCLSFLPAVQGGMSRDPAPGPEPLQASVRPVPVSCQRNLQGIDLTHDLRLDVINSLTAILEHDPYLDIFEQSDIERVIGHLDAAHQREAEDLSRSRKPVMEGEYQTAILDPVVPVVRR